MSNLVCIRFELRNICMFRCLALNALKSAHRTYTSTDDKVHIITESRVIFVGFQLFPLIKVGMLLNGGLVVDDMASLHFYITAHHSNDECIAIMSIHPAKNWITSFIRPNTLLCGNGSLHF